MSRKRKPELEWANEARRIIQNESLLETLRRDALTYAAIRGNLLHNAELKSEEKGMKYGFMHVPCTLIPTPTSRFGLTRLEALGPIVNRLLVSISRHPTFLRKALQKVSEFDEFIRRLLDLWELDMQQKERAQPLLLGITRADFFFAKQEKEESREGREGRKERKIGKENRGDGKEEDQQREIESLKEKVRKIENGGKKSEKLKRKSEVSYHPHLVELNTIAAGMGPLSLGINEMHRYFMSRYLADTPYADAEIPQNKGLVNLVSAIASAVAAHPYSLSEKADGPPYVLFVCQDHEKNIVDHKLTEYELWKAHRIPSIRLSLAEINERGIKREGTQDLIIDSHVIAVTYFRAGYTPKDFPSEAEWKALTMIELSRSIKCPTVGFHLSGTKKVQQLLGQPGVIEEFLTKEEAELFRSTLVGTWTLEQDNEHTKELISKALHHPSEYVLKPQREGGGNNLWGADLVRALSSKDEHTRSSYILMERIRPVVWPTVAMRNGALFIADCVTEVGVFYYYLGTESVTKKNWSGGTLLRTKGKDTEEGGVSCGSAFIDSPMLVLD